MRIVAVADTHLRHERLAIPYGGPDDVLVHAGDLCQHGTLEELARAADFLGSLPHRTKIVVAGNHDTCLQRQPDEARELLQRNGLVYLEDDAVTVDGVRFYGSPWQPVFRVWAFGARRGAELAEKWARIPEGVDVLVTHGPPFGFGDRVRRGKLGAKHLGGHPDREIHVGCVDLRRRLGRVRPKLHLFGHIHQDPGHWAHDGSLLANVTTAEGTRPAAVFELDLRRARGAARVDQNETFGGAVDSGDDAAK